MVATLFTARMADAQPLVRMFELQTDPAQTQAFDLAGRRNMQASSREEPGVLAMHAVAREDNPGVAYVFEIYADDAAYRRHVETGHYQRFVEETRSLINGKQLIETDPVFLTEKPAPLSAMQRGNAPEVRIVEVTVKREDLAEFRRIVVEEMGESMKVEPGVLAMYAVTRKQQPERWIFFEIYADAAAYASHRETPHFKEYLRMTGDMLVDKGHVEIENIALQSRGGLRFDASPSR
jgi:quinol monooxygenase YgiN